ncbi:MAG TPA: hypothetical protein EYN88_00040, partial [Candidatus Poseidoniales archaeon]|nr:hypothetical protein [Candidatus Poseidoniales archaeon]
MIDPGFLDLGYLLSAGLFIFGLKMLGHPRTAPRGNQYGMMGMATSPLIAGSGDGRKFQPRQPRRI